MRRMLQRSGFSLIELSVVLVIIGFIAGSAMSVGLTRTDQARTQQTKSKIERIEQLLAAYLELNGYLPCPADPSLDESNANFGVAASDAATGCAATVANGGGDAWVGAVPVTSLDLPNTFALDGWERKYTYMLDQNFERKRAFAESTGGITILDAMGNTRTAEGVVVLLSHGKNGHGAWLKSGGASRNNPGAGGAAETTNSDAPGTPLSFDRSFVQAGLTSEFDDILSFKTKIQLVRQAGAVRYDANCEIANRTLMPLDLTAVPVEGPVGCDSNAVMNFKCAHTQTSLAKPVQSHCLMFY